MLDLGIMRPTLAPRFDGECCCCCSEDEEDDEEEAPRGGDRDLESSGEDDDNDDEDDPCLDFFERRKEWLAGRRRRGSEAPLLLLPLPLLAPRFRTTVWGWCLVRGLGVVPGGRGGGACRGDDAFGGCAFRSSRRESTAVGGAGSERQRSELH